MTNNKERFCRSRTRLVDFVIDAAMIPVAAARVWLRRAGRGGRLAPVAGAGSAAG